MELNYRHSLDAMNRELSAHKMRFGVIAESSNRQNRAHLVFILHEYNASSDKISQTCGYYYTASDAVEFINKLNGYAVS